MFIQYSNYYARWTKNEAFGRSKNMAKMKLQNLSTKSHLGNWKMNGNINRAKRKRMKMKTRIVRFINDPRKKEQRKVKIYKKS